MTTTAPRTLTLDVAFQQAVAHHQAGRLQEAEQLYRAILQAQPYQPDANHNLGLLAGQVGQHAAALPYLKTALVINPSNGQYSLSYAEALLASGQANDALNIMHEAMRRGLDSQAAQALRQKAEAAVQGEPAADASGRFDQTALPQAECNQLIVLFKAGRYRELEHRTRVLVEQYPNSGFAWKLLGACLRSQGKEARSALQKATELLPDDAEAHSNLGNALRALGQLHDAVASYRRALKIKPDFAVAHSNLGNALRDLGQVDDAVASYRRALEIKPDFAEVHANLGNALRDLGRLDDAVASCRQALQIKPDFAVAHSILGAALRALGQLDDAVASYRRALEIKPDFAEVHSNLANALHALGQLDDAVASCRRALQIKPDFAQAHSNLGNALRDLGQLDHAVASYRRALEIKPDFADAHSNLGNALRDLGQLNDAVASYRRALEIKPEYAEAHSNLGSALRALGQLDEAVASYRRALEINPNIVEVHSNLGAALGDLGQLDEAVASYRRALEINPGYAEAHSNLGSALRDLGHLDEAMASCRRALQIKPGYAEANYNLGVALQSLGQLDDAIASYRRAVEIKPDFAEAHSNMGNILQASGQLDTAVASYRRALEIEPNYAEAHSNLGNALKDLGQLDDAVASYRRALEIKPDFADAHSNLLFCLSHNAEVDAAMLFSEHCRFGEQFEGPLRANWPQHSNSRDPERRLQVGFVSGDLRNHVVASFIEPVLTHLSRHPRLSLHAYSNHAIEDAVTQRLRGYLTHWHPIVGLSDEVLAQRIREDRIDILIDLSGHTGHHRLLTFARKPAPVQVSWMGYAGTTGLRAMDYYLADRFFLPPGQFDSQFTESLVYLTANAPFLPSEATASVNVLPALSNGYMTFGSFNRPGKISRSIIALWSQLLRSLPDSRMLLGGMPEEGKFDTLIEWFAQEGIARDRLSFHVRSAMDCYLSLHHQVDICLDTFPYNGGTTTLHALWMGVPTLTLAGSTAASRSGASILGHVGLEAFVAHDAENFVQKGLSRAGNPAALSDIRIGLRERIALSAIGQPALVAESLQRALRIMWQRWCARLPAASFEVPLQGVSTGT